MRLELPREVVRVVKAAVLGNGLQRVGGGFQPHRALGQTQTQKVFDRRRSGQFAERLPETRYRHPAFFRHACQRPLRGEGFFQFAEEPGQLVDVIRLPGGPRPVRMAGNQQHHPDEIAQKQRLVAGAHAAVEKIHFVQHPDHLGKMFFPDADAVGAGVRGFGGRKVEKHLKARQPGEVGQKVADELPGEEQIVYFEVLVFDVAVALVRLDQKDVAGGDRLILSADPVNAPPGGDGHEFVKIAVFVFAGGIDCIAVQGFAADEAEILPRHIVGNAFADVLMGDFFHDAPFPGLAGGTRAFTITREPRFVKSSCFFVRIFLKTPRIFGILNSEK